MSGYERKFFLVNGSHVYLERVCTHPTREVHPPYEGGSNFSVAETHTRRVLVSFTEDAFQQVQLYEYVLYSTDKTTAHTFERLCVLRDWGYYAALGRIRSTV